MSTLIVEVCKIDKITNHKNADLLDLVIVKGWQCVVKKDSYKAGDIIIFVPPEAILPIEFAEKLGVRNYLTGSNKDRVRCAKLRGEMSYGLIIDNFGNWPVGKDVQTELGIIKYEPPVRTNMGDAAPEDVFFEKYTDIENLRNYPDVFKEGEKVVVKEKADGSNFRLNLQSVPTFLSKLFPKWFSPKFIWQAGSHKVNRKKPTENIEKNTYWYPYTQPGVQELLKFIIKTTKADNVILYGEIYGAIKGGLKSMHYGKPGKLSFVAFDIMIDGKYVDFEDFTLLTSEFKVPTVPLIDIIEYNFEIIEKLSNGPSLLAERNGTKHIREGIVIVPMKERTDPKIGRVILKLHGSDYLDLKAKKEAKGEAVDFKDE